MSSRNRAVLLAGVVAAVTFSAACNRIQEVTVYPLLTIGDDRPYAAEVAVYRVDVEKQDVMFWRPGVVESPERLTNCAVRDVANWRCETSVAGDFGVVTMDRGAFEETVAATKFKVRGVSRAEWEKARVAQGKR